MTKKILIVDDDENAREIYAEVFKRAEFEVLEAIDGLEGLDKATKEIPDIIFTGIIMPRMDGFALKDALAKNVATANIPVVMSSHMGREEDRIKAEEMGIRDFIVQGMVSPKEVVEKIKTLFFSGDYKIKFNPNEMDAFRLAEDLGINSAFKCSKCQNEMILSVKISDANAKQISGKFVCLNCSKNSNV